MAYGYLGLKPDEFADLQIREFYQILEGKQAEEKRQDQKTAYWLCWLVNTQVKNPLSPNDLFLPLYPEDKKECEKIQQQNRETDEEFLHKEFAWALGDK